MNKEEGKSEYMTFSILQLCDTFKSVLFYPEKPGPLGQDSLFEKGVLGTLKKDIAESERMLKVLIKSLENKSLNPWTLFSN